MIDYSYYYPHHQFFGPSFFSILWDILLIWVVVAVLYRLFNRKNTDTPSPSDDYHTPLEILKRRYVRGKITKKEFESLKKDIA